MGVIIWAIFGGLLIFLGTALSTCCLAVGGFLNAAGGFIMFYFPYKESKDNEFLTKEAGKISRLIPLDISVPIIGNGETRFVIQSADHLPFLSDGKQHEGVLFVPSSMQGSEGILYAWIQDQEMKLSITVYDQNRNVITYISGNEWTVNKSKEIDCNYDSSSLEVVKIEGDSIRPVLQVQLRQDYVQLSFETVLRDGTKLGWGNGVISIELRQGMATGFKLSPIFVYPSRRNFGKKRK